MDLTWDELRKEVTLAVESEVRYFISSPHLLFLHDSSAKLSEIQSEPRPCSVLYLSKGVTWYF